MKVQPWLPRGGGWNKAAAFQHKSDERPRIWCDFCNKPRHTRENCWKIHGKPAHWKGKTGDKPGRAIIPTANEAKTSPFTIEQMEYLLALLKSNLTSGTPSVSVAHTGNELYGLSCCFKSTPWIIDFGASDHMTNSLNMFESYSPCPGNKKVRIADGSFSPIAGKGLIKISEGIDFKSILHVPKLTCNILFVSKLSRDSNCCVIFYESHCIFQDRSSKKTIGSARMINGLYYFEDNLLSNKIAQGLSIVLFLFVIK